MSFVYLDYQGERLHLRALSARVGIHRNTLTRWRKQGLLSADVVEAELRDREMLALASSNGIDVMSYRRRMRCGWDENRAATVPLRHKKRRARHGRS